MKIFLTEFLICPNCLPDEHQLISYDIELDKDEILSGYLRCQYCDTRYPILEGIAFMQKPTNTQKPASLLKYETDHLLASYLWSHYSDLFNDQNATESYKIWADLISPSEGLCLDAGCAVGRFTFEMSNKNQFTVGMDNSHAFIRKARQFLHNPQIDISMPIEGLLLESKTFSVPQTWNMDKVDFIVGDALRIPFRKGLFSSMASLNLIDKVPLPIKHLTEMNRVAKDENSQFLISDPFSWSEDIAKREDWLGGTTSGIFSGYAKNNLLSLLGSENEIIRPCWTIETQGDLWWKIRNHKNHFEHIRSCFIKAKR